MNFPPQRQLIRNLLRTAAETNALWTTIDEPTQTLHIERLERSCNNKTVVHCTEHNIKCTLADERYSQIYSAEAYRLISNLDIKLVGADITDPHNTTFAIKLISGALNGNDAAKISSRDLCPNASERTAREVDERCQQKVNVKYCYIYECHKCGNNVTTSNSFQGRSSDECENITLRCNRCHNTWSLQ